MPASLLSQFYWAKNGVAERKDIGKLSAFEQQALESMLDVLHKDIELGEQFVK